MMIQGRVYPFFVLKCNSAQSRLGIPYFYICFEYSKQILYSETQNAKISRVKKRAFPALT